MLRVLFFAVPFAALFLIGWPWWLALAVATLVALALSVIFLSKQRGTASTSIYAWRMRDRTADDIDEDEALDSAIHPTAPTTTASVSEDPTIVGLAPAAAKPETPVEATEKP